MLRDVIRRLVTKEKRAYHAYFTYDKRRFVVWVLVGGLFIRRQIQAYFSKKLGKRITDLVVDLKAGHPDNMPECMVIRME